MNWIDIAIGAVGGGGLTTIIGHLIRARVSTHSTDRTVNADLQKHWTETMVGLVDALRGELHDARQKVADYLELKEKLAHLEEALDHIHAMLNAEGDIEIGAAQRRAQAFLRRMRPDPATEKGEQRQSVQRAISAKRLERDVSDGKID
jgi:hypothetical protein